MAEKKPWEMFAAPEDQGPWTQFAPLEEKKPAPFSLKNIGLAFGQGLTGASQDISSLAGATNPLAKGLGSLQQTAGEAMTPERQAEIQRRQQRQQPQQHYLQR